MKLNETDTMAYQTDERLKSYLDTNQLHREQMALAILAIDKRFTEVRPRHPRGGPDGGRDIEALFRGTQLAFGAVGFVNQADDSEDKKRNIRAKFADDLESALRSDPAPEVFAFLTNVNLTVGEKDQLVGSAKERGIIHCEVFDRERLRIALDSADGFAIRFQYLAIALSEEEQASFFARWGDDINSVIATGFQQVQKTLDHLLFLQEANDSLQTFQVAFELDREYTGEEIGHFRAFCLVYLKEPKLNILSVLFGATDKADRFNNVPSSKRQLDLRPGMKFGIGAAQWEQRVTPSWETGGSSADAPGDMPEKYARVGTSAGVGMNVVRFLPIQYYTNSFIRFEPVLSLRDFNDCMLMPILNLSFAKRVQAVHIISNGYKLLEVGSDSFEVDETRFETSIPVDFDDGELCDPWVRIRPKGSSNFRLSFSEEIPQRLYVSRRTRNSSPLRQELNIPDTPTR
jgi:hypothetical protein